MIYEYRYTLLTTAIIINNIYNIKHKNNIFIQTLEGGFSPPHCVHHCILLYRAVFSVLVATMTKVVVRIVSNG